MKKVAALFIDAENLFFTQKNGWPIDFERLYAFFAQHYSIYNAFFYTVVDPSHEENYEEKKQFLDNLAFEGYTVRSKLVKLIRAGDKVMRKGNVDIEMVVDMFNTRDLYDVVILFSGDSDFERALELLRTYGKEVLVVSAKGSVARELINAADKYIDLEVIKEEIAALPDPSGKNLPVIPKLRHLVPSSGTSDGEDAPKDSSPVNTRVGSQSRRGRGRGRGGATAAAKAKAEEAKVAKASEAAAPDTSTVATPEENPAEKKTPVKRPTRRRTRRAPSRRQELTKDVSETAKAHTEKYRVKE